MDNRETPINDNGRFLSTDSEDFWLDEPGDPTIRPCRPSLLEHAKAERAKIMAALAAGVDLTEQEIFFDEPGDTTVRPCDPRFLEHVKAERAKIMAAQAANGQQADEAHAE